MSTQHEELIKRVENLLDQDSAGQDDALSGLQKELKVLRQDSELDVLEQILQILGTAVGKQKQWQTPFREVGILGSVLEDLRAGIGAASLKKQFLRVIGNSVADNDLNREVVTKNLDSLIRLVTDQDLSTIALIVLFNLCNDFDPAKAASASLRLDTLITAELSAQRFAPEAIDYAVDLLTWTTGKLTAEQLKDEQSISSFHNLLQVTLQYDEDHYHEYVAILVHYLQDPDFQERICRPDNLDNLVVLMLDFEARLSFEEIEAVFHELAITKTDDTPPSEETTVLLLSQLVNSISGISATNAFTNRDAFNLTTPVVERMRTKLALPADDPQKVAPPVSTSPSTMAACVLLGNLATSDEVCITMVRNWRIPLSLREILLRSTHSALLYAATGFLRHLAFPEPSRSDLGRGTVSVIEACQHVLLTHPTDAAVTGEVAALLSKLATNNPHNIERMLHAYPNAHVDPALQNRTPCLETLVNASLAPAAPLPSTSMKNLSVEAGRAIVSILRSLGHAAANSPDKIDTDTMRHSLCRIPHIARPLARLVRQRFYADARAEGLLGLGLLAQSAEGAACVVAEMQEDEGLLGAIGEVAEGKEGGVDEQGGNKASGREYQNAMVLLQAVQNHSGGAVDEGLREGMGRLQEELGKLMV